MKVALIRNVEEARSLSMPFYADSLRDALRDLCEVQDARFRPDSLHRLASLAGARAGDYAGRFVSFPKQLRSLRADVFHIADHSNAHFIRSLDAEATVVTCHDLMLLKLASGEIPSNGAVPRIALRAFSWSVGHLCRARVVLCDSESTKRDVIKFLGCPDERLKVAYIGIHEAFRPIGDAALIASARARFGFDSPLTVVHAGNCSFYKNLEGVINAFSLLPPGIRARARLVKVGADFSPEQWRLIQRRGIAQRVSYLGRLSVPDLALAYGSAGILLFPSLYEGFGWPPLEAMACGLPVVCSDRGSLGEVVGDAAAIVDPDSPESIAEGVRIALDDDEFRRGLIARGFERVKLFSWHSAARQVLEAYRECVS
ncbi:MAG: glycosyltransferase family 4 protein [Deltaproteobacteria bacterium]